MLSGGKNARYSRSSVEFAEQGWGRGSHSSPGLESAAGGGADRSRTAKFTSKQVNKLTPPPTPAAPHLFPFPPPPPVMCAAASPVTGAAGGRRGGGAGGEPLGGTGRWGGSGGCGGQRCRPVAHRFAAGQRAQRRCGFWRGTVRRRGAGCRHPLSGKPVDTFPSAAVISPSLFPILWCWCNLGGWSGVSVRCGARLNTGVV